MVFALVTGLVSPQASAQAGDIVLASTSSFGVKGDQDSRNVSISSDGTRIAFMSSARNLEPADPDSSDDIYVKNLSTGRLHLASNCTYEPEWDPGTTYKLNANVLHPAISGNGQKVAFTSTCPYWGTKTPGAAVWVWDFGGTIRPAAVDADGYAVPGTIPSVSATGGKVAFTTNSHSSFLSYVALDPRDQDSLSDVYVSDLMGSLTLVSTSTTGTKGNGDSFESVLSADGVKVAFASKATNLDPADVDTADDVYVKDLATGQLLLASTSDAGVKGNGSSRLDGFAAARGSISGNGNKIVFESRSTNLDPADTDPEPDVYVKDLATGDIQLVSASASGVRGNHWSFTPAISSDGAKVAFMSHASNFDPADTDSQGDIYVKDLASGAVTLASTSDLGTKSNSWSSDPAVSEDGTYISFHSYATNLDPGDTDAARDIYIKQLSAGSSAVDSSPPTTQCGSPDGSWHAADAVIACTASDSESGLANPADANFSLSTNVPAGAEDPNASTNSRNVCDNAGNCTTAGPISANKVDKRAPSISIASPIEQTYLLGQSVLANYSCVDAGSGVATCAGPVAVETAVDTASVGTKQFVVNAADAVSNPAAETRTYVVAYDEALLYDPNKPGNQIKVQLRDASGANVSQPAVVLNAVSIDGSLKASGAFTYKSNLQGYLFRAETRGLSGGPHTLEFKAGNDTTVHSVPFSVR